MPICMNIYIYVKLHYMSVLLLPPLEILRLLRGKTRDINKPENWIIDP